VVDAKTGKKRWSSPLRAGGVAGDVVLLTTSRNDPDPRMEAHDASGGALLWRRDPPVYGAVPLGSRFAIGNTPDSRVVVDARTGRDLYSFPGIGLPASGADTVAWADRTTLHVTDAATGIDRWSVALSPDHDVTSTAIGKDKVYVAHGCYAAD
jgi:outer membrane protein assembly factor BamB